MKDGRYPRKESGMIGPKPYKGSNTQYRICGPYPVSGMSVWRVFHVWSGQQMGNDCFSIEEAKELAYACSIGRIKFFYKGIGFKRSDDK